MLDMGSVRDSVHLSIELIENLVNVEWATI